MTLPGKGRFESVTTTLNGFNGATSDPAIGRRIDGLDNKIQGQENSQRNMMDQMMKLSQELKLEMRKKDGMLIEEKNARIKVEQRLLNCMERLVETEERIKRIEGSSRENKNALGQLISHTKNVERAVTMNQQDMMQRKEAQAHKMQELNEKLATMVKSRENLERHSHTMQDEINELQNKMDNQSLEVKDVQGGLRVQNKMFEAQNQKLAKGYQENENGKRMSESTKSALEAKILQLQNFVMEVQSKLNHEKKERENHCTVLTTRIGECNTKIVDTHQRREAELKEVESKTKELAVMSDAEKQRIVVQISSVQTELKRTMDERDASLKQTTVERLENLQKELKQESKQRLDNEVEMRNSLETLDTKTKKYCDESVEASRQITGGEIETLRTRTQEFQEYNNDLEIHLVELQNESKEIVTQNNTASDGREKLLEAKIEDLSDRLRLGMGKLQQAIGESSASVGRLAPVDASKFQMQDSSGLREKMQGDMNVVTKEMTVIKTTLQSQQQLIDNQLRSHQQQGEEQSTILGDKLQQKMDAVAFTQERMKRQFDDLQEKTQLAPTEIFEMKEKIMDFERDFKGANKERKLTKERLEALETDVNHVMGRGETSNVSGIPTLDRLLNDIDEVKGSNKKVKTEFYDFKHKITEQVVDEIRLRESDVERLEEGQIRAEQRTKALKERVKQMVTPGSPGYEIFEDEEEMNE